MTLVMGIDPSAKKIVIVAHHVEINTTQVIIEHLYKTGSQTPESLSRALSLMLGVAAGDGQTPENHIAYIETPIIGRGGASATIKQAYVGGIIRACLAQQNYRIVDANPSKWRAGLGIKPNKTTEVKAATLEALNRLWPKIVWQVEHDEDAVDAAAICLYGQSEVAKAARFGSAYASQRGVSVK